MIDIANDLENIKTSLMGYDKEQILLYLKGVLQQCEEEKQNEMSQLLDQNQKLQMECTQAKETQNYLKQQYDSLLEQMQEMTAVLNQSVRYANQRDEKLEAYQKKEQELNDLYENVRKKAEEEREQILQDAKEQQEKMLEEAKQECSRRLDEAERQKAAMLAEGRKRRSHALADTKQQISQMMTEAEKSYQEVTERMVHCRDELAELAVKLGPILFPERRGDLEATETSETKKKPEPSKEPEHTEKPELPKESENLESSESQKEPENLESSESQKEPDEDEDIRWINIEFGEDE